MGIPSGFQTYRLSTGGYADVPNDKAEEWARRMDARGIQFEPAPPSADMQVGEPEIIKTPRQQYGASGEWGADEDMGFMEAFANRAKQYPSDLAKAGEGFVRGLNQSLYMGGADEVEAAGLAASRWQDYGAALAQAQANRERAWNETPITYGAGRALGFVPGLLAGGPLKQGAIAAAKRFGSNVALAGLSGFLGDDGNLEDRSVAAARDMAIAAPLAGVGEIAFAKSPAVRDAGVGLRRANAGGTQPELNAIRQERGMQQMDTGINEDFERLGMLDSGWGGFKPQSAKDVYNRLGPEEGQPGMIQSAGRELGSAVDDAGELGVRGDWDSVRQLIDNSARDVSRGTPAPTAAQKSMEAELLRIAREELPEHRPMAQDSGFEEPSLAAKVGGDYVPPSREMARPPGEEFLEPDPGFNPNLATPRELQNQKVAFEESGYPPPGTVSPPAEGMRQAAYRQAAAAPRAELDEAMMNAPMDLGRQFRGARDTIERAQPIAAMAGNRAAANKAGGGAWRMPLNVGGGITGAGLGYAAAGIPGAIGGAAIGGMANSAARNYGQDVAGIGLQKLVAPTMQGGGNLMRGAGWMAPEASSINPSGLPENTRGYMTPDVAKQLVMQNPQVFGQYTQQFVRAAQNPDPDEMVRLLDRLETTDPEWQQNYLPGLLRMTAQR